MTKEIELFKHPIKEKVLLTDPDNLDSILNEINILGSFVFDLDTEKGVEEAKEIKSVASEWIKDLKDFCKPLEAEGKKISDARSKITTRLLSGKDSVINNILEPIVAAERELKNLNLKIATPIQDLHSCDMRLEEAEELKDFNWLVYKDQAHKMIDQLILVVTTVRNRFENEAVAEQERQDEAVKEREALIAKNSREQGAKEAEEKLNQEKKDEQRREEDKKAAAQAIVNAEKRQEEAKKNNREHRYKIHTEISQALDKVDCSEAQIDWQTVIKLISKGEIPHLMIKY